MKEQKQLEQLPGFCTKLWTGFDLTTVGGISPCCFWKPVSTLDGSEGNPKAVLDKHMKGYRETVLAGTKLEQCKVCWEQENRGLGSQRIDRMVDLSEELKSEILSTDQGGEFPLSTTTLRFSNRCNLRCMMCGDYNSSSWETFFKVKRPINSEELQEKILKYLGENLEGLREIYLAGGEPVLIDSCWKILDLLIERKANWVELKYNTNMSTVKYKGRNIIDRWKEWILLGGKLSVGMSIDAVGKAAEACRQGCDWKRVNSNILQLLELQSIGQVEIYISPCIGNHNILFIPELLKVAIQDWNLRIGGGTFGNMLIHPPHLSLRNLPDTIKTIVLEELSREIYEAEDGTVKEALTCLESHTRQYMNLSEPVKDLASIGKTKSELEWWYLERYPKWLELDCKLSRWWWWYDEDFTR